MTGPWAQGFKMDRAEGTGNATKLKTAEGRPGQEGPRQTKNRVRCNTTRRHKSDPRGLPVFPTTGGGRGE